MPNPKRASCWNCNRHRSEVGELSWTGLCEKCGLERLEDNVFQQVAKEGPNWQRRTAGIRRYMARLLLDVDGVDSHAAGDTKGDPIG